MDGRPNCRNEALFKFLRRCVKRALNLHVHCIFDSFCFFVFSPGDISKQFSDADEVQAEVAKVKFS